jgi:DNA-binding MarR family transcriptional regulator
LLEFVNSYINASCFSFFFTAIVAQAINLLFGIITCVGGGYIMHERSYLGQWIAVLHRMMQSYFDRVGKEYGISSGHIFFLLCLYLQEGINQDAISKRLNVDKATTARAIATLETLGYVLRRQDSKDKRAYNVFLTDKAKMLEPNIRAILTSWTDILTREFIPEEHELVCRLMQRMYENALAGKTADCKTNRVVEG